MHAPLKTLKELSSRLHSHASDDSADASAVDEGRPLRRPGQQEGCRTLISPLNGRAMSLVLSAEWDREFREVRPALRSLKRSGLVTTKLCVNYPLMHNSTLELCFSTGDVMSNVSKSPATTPAGRVTQRSEV
jgi:hypothetical protein